MAQSPRTVTVSTPDGPVTVHIRYVRPFRQVVPIEFCWAFRAGIDHSCDEMGCWPTEPTGRQETGGEGK